MITHEQIRDAAVGEACRQFNMEPGVILGRPRSESEAIARHAVCAALRSIGLPFTAIGDLVNRSHGAAMNSLKRHNDMMSTSHVYRARADAVICAAQMARDGKTPTPTEAGPATTPIGNQIKTLADQVKYLEEDLAQRLGQLRNALTERDRFRMQAEQKRGIRTELRKALGMPDTVTIEEECEWALYRISGLQIAARQRDELLTRIRGTSAAAVILGEAKL